jgi:hypothetical protein
MNKIIAIIAGLMLVYYFYKKYKDGSTQPQKVKVPVDEYGVVVEPNQLDHVEMVNDIQSLI